MDVDMVFRPPTDPLPAAALRDTGCAGGRLPEDELLPHPATSVTTAVGCRDAQAQLSDAEG